MSVPFNFLEQVERKQREFLNELIQVSQLWTKPSLTEEQVLAAGRRVGLEPIMVSEFLVYWSNAGELDQAHFLRLADSIRANLSKQVPADAVPLQKSERTLRKRGRGYDLFISHASEDKDPVARPLFEQLAAAGLHVWFDEAELTLGDSLRQRIDEGLANCRLGVVVLSPSFLAKKWPQRELDGLVTRETLTGEKTVLPVLHELEISALAKYSPTLADKLSVSTRNGIPLVAEMIVKALRRLAKR